VSVTPTQQIKRQAKENTDMRMSDVRRFFFFVIPPYQATRSSLVRNCQPDLDCIPTRWSGQFFPTVFHDFDELFFNDLKVLHAVVQDVQRPFRTEETPERQGGNPSPPGVGFFVPLCHP
jgi:hypothetical protein